MYWTLGQAAKETGHDKSKIYRAIKAGKLSIAERNGNAFSLDPSEVMRLFPRIETLQKNELQQTDTQGKTLQNSLLSHKIEFLEQQLRDIRGRLDTTQSEKERLLQIVERQTLLIEDHSKKLQEGLQKPIEQPRSFWARLMGKKT
jgi:TolA-binding protein